MLIVVVMEKGLHKQSHKTSGEKHTYCIFEGEGKFLISLVVVMLDVSEVVQYCPHHELVEENNADEGNPGNSCGSHYIAMTLCTCSQ